MVDVHIPVASNGRDDSDAMPKAAAWLGGSGLLPFIAGTLLIVLGDASWATTAFRSYAASILSFMGGVQWGLAMAAADSKEGSRALWRRLSFSVLPALVAWLALLLPALPGLLILTVAFGLLLIGDLAAVRGGWAPAWYATLRLRLSVVVLICLIIAMLGLSTA